MAAILITDLTQSSELDREAMKAIAGGARVRGQGGLPARLASPGSARIVDYPPGFARNRQADAGETPPGSGGPREDGQG